MEQNQLAKRIAIILDELACLGGSICVMKAMDVRQDPEYYEELSTEAALLAEKITCQLRSLVYATTRVQRSRYLAGAGAAHGIEIEQKGDVWRITLPCLLPKKKGRQSALFLGDPLSAVLEEYAIQNPLPHMRECVVCFCHIYDRMRPLWQIPDSDNLQQKQVLDLVSTFFLIDDNGLLCSIYTTAARGENPHTEVYVMEKKRFPAWLQAHEKEQEKRGESI